ncbi:MAG: preprotein translocase subunit YajC [Clostridiaceae bacterium]|nr:preprotein translocase subunit YajC [Clostridiaceae bacterium]MDY5889794.1 preprotein translocase subunit YajC [Oscillospiraceae bacterium]
MEFLAAQATSGKSGSLSMILMMAAIFAVMYFLMIRPQKKKQKEEQAMRDNLQIGDEITTIGGIVGKIVTVKDDTLIIETGADRNRMKITRWAISQNNTANEKLAAERAAAKEAAEKEKAARMEAKGKTPKSKKKKEEKY